MTAAVAVIVGQMNNSVWACLQRRAPSRCCSRRCVVASATITERQEEAAAWVMAAGAGRLRKEGQQVLSPATRMRMTTIMMLATAIGT